MVWNGLVRGGRYELVPEGAYRAPVFTFEVLDVEAVEAFLDDHYVHFEVCWGDEPALLVGKGLPTKLAYFMSAPDLSADAASIEVAHADQIWVAAGQGLRQQHTTVLVDRSGGRLELDRFTKWIFHDWTGGYARAERVYRMAVGEREAEHLELARKAIAAHFADIEPKDISAYHLYGKVWSRLGEHEMAAYYFSQAVRRALPYGESYEMYDVEDALLPVAAASLVGVAAAFEAVGKKRPAAACLHHALAVRPRFKEARAALERLGSPAYAGARVGRLRSFEDDAGQWDAA